MSIARKTKALIVDDKVTSRLLLGDTLQRLGFTQIAVANGGEQAYQIMRKEPHHLVISDFNIPGMDGLGLLRAIRTNAVTKRAAVFLLLAQRDNAVMRKAASLGANDVLVKPCSIDRMRAAIEAVFGPLE